MHNIFNPNVHWKNMDCFVVWFLLLFACLFFKFTDSMTPQTHAHIFLKTKQNKTPKNKKQAPDSAGDW